MHNMQEPEARSNGNKQTRNGKRRKKMEKLIAFEFSYFMRIYSTELLCIHPLLSAHREIRTLCLHTENRSRACSQLYPRSVFKMPYFARALAKGMQLVRFDFEDSEDFILSSDLLIHSIRFRGKSNVLET